MYGQPSFFFFGHPYIESTTLLSDRLHMFLIFIILSISIPLTQSKQKFLAMDVQIRDSLKEWMIESARKFGSVRMYIWIKYYACIKYKEC